MPKFLNKIILIFICLTGTIFFVPDVFAYNNVTTHPALTDEAVDLYNFFPTGAEITSQEKEWMIEGSNKEDVLPRPMNHFYDPIHKTAWTGAKEGKFPSKLLALLSTLAVGTEPVSAVEWITDSFNQQKYAYYEGDRSWPKAIEYCASGNLNEAYKTLGYILHLIQDMAMPEHTRDDSHAAVSIIGDDGSPYEDYTAQWNRNNLSVAQELKNRNISLPQKSTISDYLMSAAEYSNKYFFSADTINDIRYPLPKVNVNNTDQCDENFCYGRDENGQKFPIAKLRNKWDDINKEYVFILEILNRETYYPILNAYFSHLSKLAVLNGAGVIALFQKQCADAVVNKDFPTHLIAYDVPKLSNPLISLVGEAAKVINSVSNFISGILGTGTEQQPGITPSLNLVVITPFPTPQFTPQPSSLREDNIISSPIIPTPSSFYSETARVVVISQAMPTVSVAPGPLNELPPTPRLISTPTPTPTSQSLAQYFSSGYSANPAMPTPKPTPTPIVYCDQANVNAIAEKSVIINEIAWMGTENSSNDEWIELKNISDFSVNIKNWQLLDKDEQIKIVFGQNNGNTILAAGEFYLLERTDDNSIPAVVADLIYSGALNDSEESLKLFDQNCYLIDKVEANPNWPAGDKIEHRTQERGDDFNWHAYTGNGVGGVLGTPRQENSDPLIVTPTPTPEITPTLTPDLTPTPTITPEGLIERTPTPEPTPTLEPTAENSPSVTPEPTAEPSISPEPTVEPTPTFTPEPEPTPTPIPIPTPTLTPEPEPTITPTPTPTPIPKIFISEVMYDESGSYKDREFIELYDADGADFDLTNWRLKLLEVSDSSTFDLSALTKEESASARSLATFGYGAKKDEDITKIKRNGYLLIGLNEYASSTINNRTPDIWRSSAKLRAEDGLVYYILLLDADYNLVDSIIYNKQTFSEDIVLERKALSGEVCVDPQFDGKFLGNGCDTDTVDDFILHGAPKPQNSQSLIEPRPKPAIPANIQGEIREGDQLILSFDLNSAPDNSLTFPLKYSLLQEDFSEENWYNLAIPDSQYLGLNPNSQRYEFLLRNFSAGTYYFSLESEDPEGLRSDVSDTYEFVIPFCIPHYVDVGNPYITNIAFYSCLGKNWLDFTYYNFPNPFLCEGRYCALGLTFFLNISNYCKEGRCIYGFSDNLPSNALNIDNWHEKKIFIISDNPNISSLDNLAGNFTSFHFEVEGDFQAGDLLLPATFKWDGSNGWWWGVKEALVKDCVFFEENPRQPLVLEPWDFSVSFDEVNQKIDFQSTPPGQSDLNYEVRYSTTEPINGFNWFSSKLLASGVVSNGKIEVEISGLPVGVKSYLGWRIFNGYRYSSVGQLEIYVSLPILDCAAVGDDNLICENFENYQVGDFLGAPNYQQGNWISGNNSGPWQVESEMGVASSQFLRAAYAYWMDHTIMRKDFPLTAKGALSLWIRPKSNQSQMYLISGIPFQLINGSSIQAYNNGQFIDYSVKVNPGQWANWQFKWDASLDRYWFRIGGGDWLELDWTAEGVNRLEFNVWSDDVYFKNILLDQE